MGRPRATATTGLIALASVGLASGCGILSPGDSSSPLQDLARNRARWEALAIESYQFGLSKSCECLAGFMGPVLVTVQGGVIVGVASAESGEAVDQEEWTAFDTVEGLFDLVAQAIAQDAHVLEVEYDQDRGYPTLIDLDFQEGIADDEFYIRVSELSVQG